MKKIFRIQQTTEPEESEISDTEIDLQYQEPSQVRKMRTKYCNFILFLFSKGIGIRER